MMKRYRPDDPVAIQQNWSCKEHHAIVKLQQLLARFLWKAELEARWQSPPAAAGRDEKYCRDSCIYRFMEHVLELLKFQNVS
jgi:hypothetical protein